ncbi:signal peptidase I [Clostridium sp. 'deep sea']|uniref:signal peptidase I n=1 Tax=Clostridium sp. 'deep sea' TaxID=2779445 RepID=UPI0018965378|nr:signal peptidase I [Clostridium sp. 'deep sea']QOR36066.1 signal peptidase I [Clostridium sp. 'deep sea']
MKAKAKIKEWIFIIAVAIVLSFLVRNYIFEIFIVEGKSMEPTLLSKERILVTKFNKDITDYSRGDIVVLDFKQDYGKDIVKRIIAIEGDTVEVRDSQVRVNGKIIQEGYISENTQGRYDEVTVPKGNVFVLGDNRNHSLDSRDSRIGFVDLARIKGKARYIIWPVTNWRSLKFRG